MYQHWGIGYAIFITHPDTRRSFYGHLDRFADAVVNTPKVKALARDILERRDFRIDFNKNELPVKSGDVIGYSGDSGIGREHFHFELRDRDNGNLNPLRSGLDVRDVTAPLLAEIFLIPMDEFSHVDGRPLEKSYPLKLVDSQKGLYEPAGGIVPEAAGRIGIKVKAYDTVGYRRKVSLYGLEASVSGKKIFRSEFSRLSRDENHHMGLFYDYDNSNNSVYTYYLFSRRTGEGVIETGRLPEEAVIELRAFDAAMNTSRLALRLKTAKLPEKPLISFVPNLFPGKTLELSSDDRICTVRFGKSSAFYREMVTLSRESPPVTMAGMPVKSAMYSVAPTSLCIDEPAGLAIRYEGDDYSRTGVYYQNPKKRIFVFAGGVYKNKEKAFQIDIHRMGRYFLIRDDIPPRIRYTQARKIMPGHVFRFFIADTGMGVDLNRVNLAVDGRQVSWVFDPDYGCIEILPHSDIWQKGSHRIDLQIRDRAGNESKAESVSYSIR
jgi:hypothetical protein